MNPMVQALLELLLLGVCGNGSITFVSSVVMKLHRNTVELLLWCYSAIALVAWMIRWANH
jgi:hypothetical protein